MSALFDPKKGIFSSTKYEECLKDFEKLKKKASYFHILKILWKKVKGAKRNSCEVARVAKGSEVRNSIGYKCYKFTCKFFSGMTLNILIGDVIVVAQK